MSALLGQHFTQNGSLWPSARREAHLTQLLDHTGIQLMWRSGQVPAGRSMPSPDPSVRTVISLVDTIRAEQIPVIFYIEFSSRKTADVLAEETGAKELLFHSCHNVSAEELDAGATYLSLMWNNVAALKEALD